MLPPLPIAPAAFSIRNGMDMPRRKTAERREILLQCRDRGPFRTGQGNILLRARQTKYDGIHLDVHTQLLCPIAQMPLPRPFFRTQLCQILRRDECPRIRNIQCQLMLLGCGECRIAPIKRGKLLGGERKYSPHSDLAGDDGGIPRLMFMHIARCLGR